MKNYGLHALTFENLMNDLFSVDLPEKRNDYLASKNEDAYRLSLALPGFDKKDLEISIEQEVLSIAYKGEKEEWKSPFVRRFSLPKDVDETLVEAKLDKGILTVSIPKMEEKKAKKISVL